MNSIRVRTGAQRHGRLRRRRMPIPQDEFHDLSDHSKRMVCFAKAVYARWPLSPRVQQELNGQNHDRRVVAGKLEHRGADFHKLVVHVWGARLDRSTVAEGSCNRVGTELKKRRSESSAN